MTRLLAVFLAAFTLAAAPPVDVSPERFDDLFARLKDAKTPGEADFIAEEIEALWRASGSPTADLLVRRAETAAAIGEFDLARTLVDGALEIEPDYVEGWAESAMIANASDDVSRALTDIEKAVTLAPRHYESLLGLGLILERLERWEGAYEAYERALAIHPFLEEARQRMHEIEPKARGREL